MNYKCRPGIVLTKICGEWLLIPTRAASVFCPNIIHLTLPSSLAWKILSKGRSPKDISRLFQILMHLDQEAADIKVDDIIQAFLERGVLIPEESSE